MKLIQERCLIYPKNNKRDFWPKRSVTVLIYFIDYSKRINDKIIVGWIVSNRGEKERWESQGFTANSRLAGPQTMQKQCNEGILAGSLARFSFSLCLSRWFLVLSLDWNEVSITSLDGDVIETLIRQSSPSVPRIAKIVRFLSSRRLPVCQCFSERKVKRELKGGHRRRKREKRREERKYLARGELANPRNKNGTSMFFKQFITRARAAKVPRGLRRQLYLQNNLTVP